MRQTDDTVNTKSLTRGRDRGLSEKERRQILRAKASFIDGYFYARSEWITKPELGLTGEEILDEFYQIIADFNHGLIQTILV